MSSEVLVEVSQGIMQITLNRPEAKNAVNRAMAKGIAAAVDQMDESDDIRLAIITGAGSSFCAGMDLKAFVSGEMPVLKGRGFAGLVEKPPKKPLIAAVEGFALAGGFEIALCCDLVVAADNARFGLPEAKRGLLAAAGGLMQLPRQIPKRVAMELALTGDMIDAQRAYEVGLINRVTPAGSALEEARKLASTIAANGPLAVLHSKAIIRDSQDWSQEEMFNKQQAFVDVVFNSRDAIEGAKAFAEKRKPQWTGK